MEEEEQKESGRQDQACAEGTGRRNRGIQNKAIEGNWLRNAIKHQGTEKHATPDEWRKKCKSKTRRDVEIDIARTRFLCTDEALKEPSLRHYVKQAATL